jgi:hypothetical protein
VGPGYVFEIVGIPNRLPVEVAQLAVERFRVAPIKRPQPFIPDAVEQAVRAFDHGVLADDVLRRPHRDGAVRGE